MIDWRWPFLTIDIELTNVCSQNCLFCPREKIMRPSGFLNLQLLNKILDQAAAIGSRITFCGMGNPLLHPEFVEAGRLCRSHGIRYGLTIQVPALNDSTVQMINDFQPWFIELSCSGIDQQSYERIYPGEKFATGLHNIDKLVELRGTSRGITVVSVSDKAQTPTGKEISGFWAARDISCRVFACHSRGGNLVNSDLINSTSTRIEECGLFAAHSFITWQGKLLSCCHDLTGECEIADINNVSLEEAGKRKIKILEQGMPWKLCSSCDEPAAARPLPDRPFPESEKAKKRYLQRLTQK